MPQACDSQPAPWRRHILPRVPVTQRYAERAGRRPTALDRHRSRRPVACGTRSLPTRWARRSSSRSLPTWHRTQPAAAITHDLRMRQPGNKPTPRTLLSLGWKSWTFAGWALASRRSSANSAMSWWIACWRSSTEFASPGRLGGGPSRGNPAGGRPGSFRSCTDGLRQSGNTVRSTGRCRSFLKLPSSRMPGPRCP